MTPATGHSGKGRAVGAAHGEWFPGVGGEGVSGQSTGESGQWGCFV